MSVESIQCWTAWKNKSEKLTKATVQPKMDELERNITNIGCWNLWYIIYNVWFSVSLRFWPPINFSICQEKRSSSVALVRGWAGRGEPEMPHLYVFDPCDRKPGWFWSNICLCVVHSDLFIKIYTTLYQAVFCSRPKPSVARNNHQPHLLFSSEVMAH